MINPQSVFERIVSWNHFSDIKLFKWPSVELSSNWVGFMDQSGTYIKTAPPVTGKLLASSFDNLKFC